MMLQRPRWATALTLACLIIAAGSTARAGFVGSLTATVTSQAGGIYEYDYTLSVDPTSTLNASQLFVNLGHASPVAPLTSISNTIGWDVGYTPGDALVSFTSSAASLDLTPGMSGSFQFFSTSGPGNVNYDIRSFDAAGAPLGDSVGATLAPVPEPTSLALITLGGLVLVLRRRRRSTTA